MALTQMNPEEPEQSPWTFGLGDRLAKALSVASVTSIEMADYLGVSSNTIGNYTSGRTVPKKQTLRLWAMRTGAPLEWIETGVIPDDNAPDTGFSDLKHPGIGTITSITAWRERAS